MSGYKQDPSRYDMVQSFHGGHYTNSILPGMTLYKQDPSRYGIVQTVSVQVWHCTSSILLGITLYKQDSSRYEIVQTGPSWYNILQIGCFQV